MMSTCRRATRDEAVAWQARHVPEMPEVESLAAYLRATATGLRVSRVELAAISALKTFDPPVTDLVGARVVDATRRGKFLDIVLVDEDGEILHLVTHLARAGWLHWRKEVSPAPPKPGKGPLAFRVVFVDDDGVAAGAFDLTEAGTRKRLAVYVVRDRDTIEGVARLGPEPLDEAFTVEVFARILAEAGGKQLKGVLRDQSTIAGIGNAYSDDILHAARLSPFKAAGKLSDAEVATLYAAIHDVLTDAVTRSEGLGAADLKAEKRLGMRVHGRTGEPCPVCGDAVREVSFADSSLQYCATCQTDGKPLADRRLSKLLK
jgi:formamidopyrimidine-DNA glycosylase